LVIFVKYIFCEKGALAQPINERLSAFMVEEVPVEMAEVIDVGQE
jgi:hypothetical protein